MSTLLALFGVSFGLSLLLTPLARSIARKCGLTDKPDQRRKLQSDAIPVAGGIAVFLASLATIGLMFLTGYAEWEEEFASQSFQWIGLGLASLVITCVGVADDLGKLRGRHKLLGQIVAIGILISSGMVVQTIRLAGFELDLGILAIPFTAFFLLGAINSLNLLDGMDGLLSTVALIVTLAFAIMAIMGDKWATACIAVTLAGSVLGFLRYNFPPASIYLGDAGSMLIGLVIGSLAIKSSLKGPATIALAAPLAILAIPILDTTAAIFRRKLTGRSIYTTDRGHLHHCLLRQGFSKITVLFFVAMFCLLAVAGTLLSITLNVEWLALLAAVIVAVILVQMRWFGHGEMLLVSDRLKSVAASIMKLQGPRAHDSAIQLQGTGAWSEQWSRLMNAAQDMNMRTVRLDINAPALHESYHARWVNPCGDDFEEGDSTWSAAIPLVWRGQTVGRLEVTGGRDGQPVWKKIALLSEHIGELELILCRLAEDAGLMIQPMWDFAEPIAETADLSLTK